MPQRPNPITRALGAAPGGVFVAYAIAASFLTYFCMYAFRKPFSAAQYLGADGEPAVFNLLWMTVDAKTAFVSSQLIGYAISKYVGIKVCSEMTRSRRAIALVGFVLIAEAALLGFAVLPASLKIVAIFINGLPLGMVWGLVVWYLEGRRTSELLLAGLSASFILASGVVKDVGRWLMSGHGVSEWWMPFVTGLVFLPVFLLAVGMLNLLPGPTEADERERSHREPMGAAERWAFVRRFAPGLVMLFVAYFFLTAFRDFRDNFGVEVFSDLGYGEEESGLFTRSELWVAFGVLVPLGLLFMIRNNRGGLLAALGIMLVGCMTIGLGTLGYQAGYVSGLWWMILIGLGAYLAYVPYGSVLFDRLIACTHVTGTAVFAIYIADALGYTGSISIYFFKDVMVGEMSRLNFLIGLSYFMSLLGLVLLTGTSLYFLRTSRHRGSAAEAERLPVDPLTQVTTA